MKTTLTLLTALLLTPITGLRAVDPKPTQRSVVTGEPALGGKQEDFKRAKAPTGSQDDYKR